MTKAETLVWLSEKGYPVPPLLFFTIEDWAARSEEIVGRAMAICPQAGQRLAIRSSALAEDGRESSLAGAFLSILHVPGADREAVVRAIETVRGKLANPRDQIIAQAMVEDATMSGVVTTHTLSDGSPYYVVNYDNASGRTDTVTGGMAGSRVVYVYRGVKDEYFDSSRLWKVIHLTRDLEREFDNIPLDIEFAVDGAGRPWLLQARRICAADAWNADAGQNVNVHIGRVAEFVRGSLASRHGVYGKRAILGVMTDWNPAEMIGVTPRALSLSLYRQLITKRIWSLAREKMGYLPQPPMELMLTVGGRPYIDVRASFNSFLPAHLSDRICDRLVNAWLERLDSCPGLHDKVEFDIVHTVAEPGFAESFQERYPDLLDSRDLLEYQARLTILTKNALRENGSLDEALRIIQELDRVQGRELPVERMLLPGLTQFEAALRISDALEQCREKGTLPFAIVARHGFIAETMLRAAVRAGALTQERVGEFKRGVHTVSKELTRDFDKVMDGRLAKNTFLERYGHLRPGTYDILSPAYRDRPRLFDYGTSDMAVHDEPAFVLSREEGRALDELLREADLDIGGDRLLSYARTAIAGREKAKFVFSRHISHVLELITAWGVKIGLDRDELSMLPVEDILEILYKPLPLEGRDYFRKRIEASREEYALGSSFEMSYLIRSERDIYIVPQHRSLPNFITSKRVQAGTAYLDPKDSGEKALSGLIVCIDSADPGYDWIFTRGIAGLITRYGGANSHMAIRCAEFGLPAAIGCGEVIFNGIRSSHACVLDCAGRSVTPLGAVGGGEALS